MILTQHVKGPAYLNRALATMGRVTLRLRASEATKMQKR
jgi:hypothetical protein